MAGSSTDCCAMITTMDTQPETSIASLYIPIVGSAITEDYIKHIFNSKGIALIDRVDFVFNNIKGRREAFIHINHWKEGDVNNEIKEILLKNNNYKFYFDENNKKSFWPLLITTNPVQPEQRKSTAIYSLEERINALENNIKKLHIITTQHNQILKEDSVQFDPNSNKRKRAINVTNPELGSHHCHY